MLVEPLAFPELLRVEKGNIFPKAFNDDATDTEASQGIADALAVQCPVDFAAFSPGVSTLGNASRSDPNPLAEKLGTAHVPLLNMGWLGWPPCKVDQTPHGRTSSNRSDLFLELQERLTQCFDATRPPP